MFGYNGIPSMLNENEIKDSCQWSHCIMSSIVYKGASSELQEESYLNEEINEMHRKDNGHLFKVIIYQMQEKDDVNDQSPKESASKLVTDSQLAQNKVQILTDISNVMSALQEKQEVSEKIVLAYSALDYLKDEYRKYPPYLFKDNSTDTSYSMLIDNEVIDVRSLLNSSKLLNWLKQHTPSIFSKGNISNSEVLFYWFVYNIQANGNDSVIGLYNALTILNNQKIGGQFNLLFSDGVSVFAFSKRDVGLYRQETIVYKLIRTEQNNFSYILRSFRKPDDFDWINIKPNSLYYFPVQYSKMNYIDLDNRNNADILVNKCMSWVGNI